MGNGEAEKNMLEDKGASSGGLFLLPVLSLLLGAAILAVSQKEISWLLYLSGAILFLASYLWDLKGLIFSALITATLIAWNHFSWFSMLFWLLSFNSGLLFVFFQRENLDFYRAQKGQVESLKEKCRLLELEAKQLASLEESHKNLQEEIEDLNTELLDLKEELLFTNHQLGSFEQENFFHFLEEDCLQKTLLDSIQEMSKQSQDLEEEVKVLEEVISQSFKSKPKATRSKKAKKEPNQGFLEFFLT